MSLDCGLWSRENPQRTCRTSEHVQSCVIIVWSMMCVFVTIFVGNVFKGKPFFNFQLLMASKKKGPFIRLSLPTHKDRDVQYPPIQYVCYLTYYWGQIQFYNMTPIYRSQANIFKMASCLLNIMSRRDLAAALMRFITQQYQLVYSSENVWVCSTSMNIYYTNSLECFICPTHVSLDRMRNQVWKLACVLS